MKQSKTKSKEYWDVLWAKALKRGVCLRDGCDIRTKTCVHLDEHLKYQTTSPKFKKGFVTGIDLDTVQESNLEKAEAGEGAWELFKKLRKFGLDRDQVVILVRRFAYNMSIRSIANDMNYLSKSEVQRRLSDALATLKRRGFEG